jgi:RES domain
VTPLTSRIRGRTVTGRLVDWPRILPTLHRATPADAGFGTSRFSTTSGSFRVLYAAEDFATAFAEAVVRDRFEGRSRRVLYRPHLDALCITSITSARELNLIDLTGGAAYEAGVDTDASRARKHSSGQELSEAIHTELPGVDGILFDSRLTTLRCVALYDRAFLTLSATTPIGLLQSASLPSELERLKITVRRARGFAKP